MLKRIEDDMTDAERKALWQAVEYRTGIITKKKE